MSFEFDKQKGQGIETFVYEAIGAASMCWEETPRGVFNGERAKEIGDALMEEIRDVLR